MKLRNFKSLLFLLAAFPFVANAQLPQPPRTKKLIICDGNSLTTGAGVVFAGNDYPTLLNNSLDSTYFAGGQGITGQTTTEMISRAASRIDPIIGYWNIPENILIVWEITNDIAIGGVTEQQAFENLKSYCLARKAAGWKVVVGTMLPRTAILNFYNPAQVEVMRQYVNTRIRNEWKTFADALADVGDLAVNRVDGVHLEDAGYAVIASAVRRSVLTITEPVRVLENTTSVATITPAGPLNGAVTYSIQGGEDASKFNIDPATGLLTFITPPDFEHPADVNADNMYEVTVRSSTGLSINDQVIKANVVAATVLPVNFTAITAAQKPAGIEVEWSVASETAGTLYEIEKSTDSRVFNKVAVVTATASQLSNYKWLDATVAAGDNYYRIKSVERTGRIVYSKVVRVRTGGSKSEIAVYPNPVVDKTINLEFVNQEKGTYSIRLFNGNGQQVFASAINHAGGSTSRTIQLTGSIGKGLYHLQVSNGDNSFSKQVLIN